VQARLIERARGGDLEAFDALARSVGHRCMGIASRMLRDTDMAEDAVQAALVQAWRELRNLRDLERFEPWLHRILVNACYAEGRRHRRRLETVVRIPQGSGVDAGGILTVDDRDQLERALGRLSLEHRAVLVFHHYLGLSVPEIADRLGVPPGTVKSRLHYSITAMRASLAADARLPLLAEDLA
jgi:RNA polymerase sigma factor (sigma-70 family)